MEFKRTRKDILLGSLIFAAAVCAGSIPVHGMDPAFLAAVLAGFAVMNINFTLLGVVADQFRSANHKGWAVLTYSLRLVLYAAVLVAAFRVSDAAVVGTAMGILGILPGSILILLRRDGMK